MNTQLTRNSSGSHGVNHSGCSLVAGSSIMVPSDDWCMVGSSRPRASTQTSDRSTTRKPVSAQRRRAALAPAFHFSNTAGESSTISTST